MKLIQNSLLKKLSLLSFFKSNRDLKTLTQFKPSLIIISGGNWLTIYNRTFFEGIKAALPEVQIVLLNGMSPNYYKVTIEKRIFPFIDRFYTNDILHAQEWMGFGAKSAKMLPVSAIYPQTNSTELERKIDAAFVGSFYEDRHQIFEYLKQNGVDIKVWGSINQKIPTDSLFWSFYQGLANATEIDAIYSSSKIGINTHSVTMPHGGNLRTFEIPLSGCLQMVDTFDRSWFIENQEIVIFENKEELLKKVRFYLDNNELREKIAEAGKKRVLISHTYKNRMETIINESKLY